MRVVPRIRGVSFWTNAPTHSPSSIAPTFCLHPFDYHFIFVRIRAKMLPFSPFIRRKSFLFIGNSFVLYLILCKYNKNNYGIHIYTQLEYYFMRIVIDRMSDGIAYLDVDGQIIEFPSVALPAEAKEGDLLGFVILDNSEILKEGQDRLARLEAMSNLSGDFDI